MALRSQGGRTGSASHPVTTARFSLRSIPLFHAPVLVPIQLVVRDEEVRAHVARMSDAAGFLLPLWGALDTRRGGTAAQRRSPC
jgi:hypothetical protein